MGQMSNLFHDMYARQFSTDALIDELRVWDYVRSDREIAVNMHLRMPGGTAGLNLGFTFDDQDGDDAVVQDASGDV